MDTITPVLNQTSFRGRDDDVGLNVDTWNGGGGLDTNWTQLVDVNFRVRFVIGETAGGEAKNKAYQLQFNYGADGYTPITAATKIQYANTIEYINLAATTQVIGGGTFTAGDGVDNSDRTGIITLLSNETEVEFALTIDSSLVDDGVSSALRLYNVTDAAWLDSYVTASVTTDKPSGAVRRVMVVS